MRWIIYRLSTLFIERTQAGVMTQHMIYEGRRLPLAVRIKSQIKYKLWQAFGMGELKMQDMRGARRWFLAILFLVILLAWALPALSHDWYDPECCGGNDCRPVPSLEIEEIDGGYRHIPTGAIFLWKNGQVKPSRNRNFHVCIGNKPHDMGKPYCIYILQGV